MNNKDRLTTYIVGYAHGRKGVSADNLSKEFCRGEFESTALVEKLAEYEDTGLSPQEVEQLKADKKHLETALKLMAREYSVLGYCVEDEECHKSIECKDCIYDHFMQKAKEQK